MGSRKTLLASLLLASSAVLLAGCAPTVEDGARQVYAVSQICPAAGVAVKARPDLAPHTVLSGATPPPPSDIDSVSETYEISGCAQKRLFVCAHPVIRKQSDPFSVALAYADDGAHLDFNTEYFELVRGLDVDGDHVESAVVCQPGTQTIQ
jgi:hypothetical protein